MRELSPLGGSEGMELATTKGAASLTRRLRAAKGRPYARGTFMSFVLP